MRKNIGFFCFFKKNIKIAIDILIKNFKLCAWKTNKYLKIF